MVDKVGVEPTSRGGFMPAFHNATRPYYWRGGWDSNPRTLADLRFSRPVHSTAMRPPQIRDAPGELPRRPGFLLWHMTSILA